MSDGADPAGTIRDDPSFVGNTTRSFGTAIRQRKTKGNFNVKERKEPKHAARRTFLKTSAVAVAAPTIVPSSIFAKPNRPAPSDRVTVGLIGCGDLGRRHHLQGTILKHPRLEVAAVCDVDRNHRDEAAKFCYDARKTRVAVYKDFRDLADRKDLNAVFVVTPDHWHALASTYAMETGKDVYCEKPLTLTIEEGRKMVQAARRYGTVFQTGSMQRSGWEFWRAAMLAQQGHIGKIVKIDTYIGSIDAGSWQPAQTPPPNLDWNMWLGPAPYADYFPARCHYQFRWFSDYSGGKMTDWGAHHNDFAQWALAMDNSGPVKVRGKGVFHPEGPHDVAGHFDVVYTYANGAEVHCHSDGKDPHGNGALVTGTDGWIWVSRGELDSSKKELLKIDLKDQETRPREKGYWHTHYNDWLDCIVSRKRPICDVEIGHRSATVCHLGNIALKLDRELNWDPVHEQFVDDSEANLHVRKPMRAPWHL